MKTHHDIIVHFLANVFSKSINSDSYPDFLKTAGVIPIHKSGCIKDPSNHRLISVLLVFHKILERLLIDRLYIFFRIHDVLYHYQYSFRAGLNTLTATSELVDDIYKAVDKRKVAEILFHDLKRGCDTIDHHVLLQKLLLRSSVLNSLTSMYDFCCNATLN